MKYANSEHLDLLCAEYVLGTLDGPARRRFDALLAQRSDLRERLEAWDTRLNGLASGAAPVTPSPSVWEAVVHRIAPEPAQPGSRSAAASTTPFWRALALGSSATAAVLAILLLTNRPEPVEEPGYVVMLRDRSESPVWVINASPAADKLLIKTTAETNVPEGKRCYLWLQPPGSNERYRLGVLPDAGEAVMRLPAELSSMMPGQLMVSVEDENAPLDGSPDEMIELRDEWLKPMSSKI